MEEWLPRRRSYLETIIQQDGFAGPHCAHCSTKAGYWQCEDCFGSQPMCRECCRLRHSDLPFHHIEYWTGTHYERDWLCNLGVVIHLGHGGKPCPMKKILFIESEVAEPNSVSQTGAPNNLYFSPSGTVDNPSDSNTFRVLHTNGIHKVWLRQYACGKIGDEYQLLSLHLFPISYQ